MKKLTSNELVWVTGGLTPSSYITSWVREGAVGGVIIGLGWQLKIIATIAATQQTPYTIKSAVGGMISTLPILAATTIWGGTSGAVIGGISLATGMATDVN